MAGTERASIATIAATAATTNRMRLIFATSCVSLAIPAGSLLLFQRLSAGRRFGYG
jgi:hypothetical protein